MFKQELYKTSWADVTNNKNIRMMHTIKFYISLLSYTISILQIPWITRGIKISSKRKQKLYVKFLKNKNT